MTLFLSDPEPEDVPDLPENVIPVDFEQSRKKTEDKKRKEIIKKICKEAREIKW